MPSVGDIFFIDPDGNNNPHFWIVIGAANDYPKQGQTCHVVVNATSACRDNTCLLNHSDSPLFTKYCLVRYERMRFMRSSENWPASSKKGRLRMPSLRRIQSGAHISDWTPNEFLPFIPTHRADSSSTPAIPSPKEH